MQPFVLGVFTSGTHSFSKYRQASITLLKGLGIEGDAHCGVYVKHRWDAKKDPTRPNRRQVHLIQSELFGELSEQGFEVRPGDMGENITTRGIDLLALPTGTLLRIGPDTVVEVTGLRNPCIHIEKFQKGLLKAVVDRVAGKLTLRAGIMGVVAQGGSIETNAKIGVDLPDGVHEPLKII